MTSPLKLIINLAHRLGISPLMLRARREARARGEHLKFRLSGIIWKNSNGDTYLFPANQPHEMWESLHSSRCWTNRIITPSTGSGQIVDLRKPTLYRMASGRHIWLPDFIEETDTCSGYLTKGAPKSGDTVVDAGAYCGEITIELAILVGPSGHVFSLEPDPDHRALLQQNLELHHLTNVTILPYALWSHTTELTFAPTRGAGSCVQSIRASDARPVGTITVSALSPSDLFTRIGRRPDFIKMDIEGAEVEVVTALAPLLAESQDPVRLAIASYHIRDERPAHELITPPLVAIGYQVETGYPEHTTTWAWKA